MFIKAFYELKLSYAYYNVDDSEGCAYWNMWKKSSILCELFNVKITKIERMQVFVRGETRKHFAM